MISGGQRNSEKPPQFLAETTKIYTGSNKYITGNGVSQCKLSSVFIVNAKNEKIVHLQLPVLCH
jgi:hypothetical protein